MKKTISYYYRGEVERGTGEPGYRWHRGYSPNSEDGKPTYPWMTQKECIADAKAQGASAQFISDSTPPMMAIRQAILLPTTLPWGNRAIAK